MDIRTMPVKVKTRTPITTEEAKKQLGIEKDFTNDDTFVDSLVEIAIDKVECDTNSDVLETSNVLTWKHGGAMSYTIHQAPFLSVSKLEKLVGGLWSDVIVTGYEVETGFSKFELILLESVTADKLRLTYKTGYADADMPKVLMGAAKLKVADLFDSERQGYTLNVAANRAYEALISKHVRTYWG